VIPAGYVVLGLVQGSLAGLNALGIVLLWKTTRLVNLAQPSMGLVGGVLTGLLVVGSGWSFWWAAPAGLLLGSLMGLATDRLVLRRMKEAPRAVMLVATVGLAALFSAIQAGLPFAFGGRALPTYTIDLGVTVDVPPYLLRGPDILALAALPLALAGLSFFLYRTRFGLAALALGQDSERARSLGVPATLVRSVVWTVAGLVATLGGILSIPVLGFNLGGGFGPLVLLLALAPAVLAGLRSLAGAAVAALALGVAYQFAEYYASNAGIESSHIGDVFLAVAIIAAVAIQRRRLGRTETAARAASWAAAATPRPLPWSVTASKRFKVASSAVLAAAVGAAVVVPLLLAPGQQILYATSACLALAALSVGVAWMFSGEIVLGHWGLAALGATVAAVTPGPWEFRAVVAGIAIGCLGMLLGLVARRQAGLSFAVLGLAVAAAAPVALLNLGDNTIPTSPASVGVTAGCVAILAAAAMTRLRTTTIGARMVAARDDPDRAPWLGLSPLRERIQALGISGMLAGLAGGMYIAAVPAGVAPGSFDPIRSLDLLAMAVVGGLGSPAGALLGASLLQAGRHLLAGPWAALASGGGVLLVVIFRPAGLSGIFTWLRDRAVRIVTPTREVAGTSVPAEEAA
jgi:branched-subunit amino acid ABC-type transport system permease component